MNSKRFSRCFRCAFVAGTGLALAANAHALDFSVTFGNDGSAADFSADQKATINAALAELKGIYTDNVTVKLQILNSGSGLGGSSTWLAVDSYANVKAALTADKKSALDNTAVASLAAAMPFLDATGAEKKVNMTWASARALGYNVGATPDGFDATLFLNAGICFTRSVGPQANKYDLHAVAQHEADEAMGIGGPGSRIGSTTRVGVEDLFRWTGAGVRSTLSTNSVGNYFSVDGGVTNIRSFNNGNNGGDYADWAGSGPNVQDAFATPNTLVNYGTPEISVGDAVGWDVKAVPEPSTMALLGLGVAAFAKRRKKA
ncbi:MAG: PEP-CTERM sorting domain-containing protein [Armatimonadetes bacterium]|nr:PEP-CTERM sorting domain-containing protein [Armatimonadota bacterium]